jgi:O-antigen/teichoic acid export membrane protein
MASYSLKNLAGQTAVYGLSSIIGRFLNYLLTPLYTYQFIARDYGVVTEMYAYALMPVITTGLLFMAICFVLSDFIASSISYPDHSEYVVWFAIIVAFDAISSLPLAKLRHQNKAGRFAFVNLSAIALNIGLNLFFIAYCKVNYDSGNTNDLIDMCYNPAVGVGYIFIANLVSSIFKCVLLSPGLMVSKSNFDWQTLKQMLAYGSPLLIAGLAGIANENLDRLLLKYLLLDDFGLDVTMSKVGIYGACYKVSILITLFVQAYRYAAEPFFFGKSAESDARDTYAQMMKYFVIVCLVIFLALMMNIDTVMLFVGEEYREGVVIVPILLMANIFLGIYYNLSVWYKLTDKTIFAAYIGLFGAAITVVFNLILIPKLGYVGSAWATLACYSTMTITSFLLMRKHYPIPYPILKIVGYFGIVLGVFYLSSIVDIDNSLRVIVNNAILLVVLAMFYALERPKKMII